MATTPAIPAPMAATTVKVWIWRISPSMADLWFAISNAVLIAGAFAVFVGTIGSITLSAARDLLSQGRTAANEALAGQARVGAARANEGLGNANVRIADAAVELAKANAKVAEAQLETQRLKEQIAWREITPAQSEKMIPILKEAHLGEVNITYLANDAEADALAAQFERIFKKSNWRVAHRSMTLDGEAPSGIHVPEVDSVNLPFVRRALKSAGLAFDAQATREELISAGDIYRGAPIVFIGSKKPPIL